MSIVLCGAAFRRHGEPGVLEAATGSSIRPWPNRRVPYQIVVTIGDIPGFSEPMFNRITAAIDNWNLRLTGIVQFVPKTPSDTNFLIIWRAGPDRPNTSEIGFRDIGVHQIRLHDDPEPIAPMRDWTLGIVHHELGHALGLYHEHVRPDRDLFIRVNWGVVPYELYRETWVGLQVSADSRVETGYDYDSVMHYHSVWRRPKARVVASVRNEQGTILPWIGGTIEETESDGSATRIIWDNGVVLHRVVTVSSSSGIPAYFNLGGTWQSSVGAEYLFTQFSGGFTWRAPSFSQFGEGFFFGLAPPSAHDPDVILFEKPDGSRVDPVWANPSSLDVEGIRRIYA